MSLTNFIEIGRVIVIKKGVFRGKIGVIVDVIDKNRCLVDGWASRQIINVKNIKLTKVVIKGIDKKIGSRKLKTKLECNLNLIYRWCETKAAIKYYSNERKKQLDDFDIFKYKIGKQCKNVFLYSN
ncbi:60S ribosomal protein L14A (nucleomorph) [Cryptomonas paramecium]|uniref:60S ribosomal protein L14A n=1 Tax=Cryptomonas paramaecium TaxID=2898 RepID=F2HHZ6_9CRYP|nr:60S ribosomal protein L14A [Cryptomonas paramecium]AEA38942.1 60S ribosomal protein L14A [Cryptomonas paramecium]|mmetsp:Transcript_52419/g.137250  ORF Transcript_52419/g.137250 Transcript_52419/m.137250 type:complete len:126 (-) Transcript_52419:6233-6610(-)